MSYTLHNGRVESSKFSVDVCDLIVQRGNISLSLLDLAAHGFQFCGVKTFPFVHLGSQVGQVALDFLHSCIVRLLVAVQRSSLADDGSIDATYFIVQFSHFLRKSRYCRIQGLICFVQAGESFFCLWFECHQRLHLAFALFQCGSYGIDALLKRVVPLLNQLRQFCFCCIEQIGSFFYCSSLSVKGSLLGLSSSLCSFVSSLCSLVSSLFGSVDVILQVSLSCLQAGDGAFHSRKLLFQAGLESRILIAKLVNVVIVILTWRRNNSWGEQSCTEQERIHKLFVHNTKTLNLKINKTYFVRSLFHLSIIFRHLPLYGRHS